MTRSCNTQQCEFPTDSDHGLKTIQEKSILKIVQVSPRKQRYEPGVIKEGDLDWYREDIESPGDQPRIPVRVVLNNRTLSIFEANHFDTIAFSTNIAVIKTIQNLKADVKSCFVITTELGDRLVLCAMRGDTSDSAENIKNEWVRQIFFFRDHCQTEFKVHTLENDEITNIKKHDL